MSALALFLHQQHVQTPGRICPVLLPAASYPDRAKRLRELTSYAERAVREAHAEPQPSNCQVLRTHDDLVMRMENCPDVHVPLLLGEVGYAHQESTCIVAFSCRQQPDEVGTWVWLIMVEGGLAELQAFLYVLSKGGVIRSDILHECSAPKDPFAFGASSSIYKLHRLVRTANGTSERGRDIAAKVLPASRSSEVMKVEAEVQMLIKAQGHPNCIHFRGIFFNGPETSNGEFASKLVQKAVLLTDYYSAGSIWNCVQRDGTFTEGEALGLCAGVLSALAHIHAKGIIHRDIKSENVLRGNDGRAILTDFGIACLADDTNAMQLRCGTPGYAAPEVLSDSPYGKKVDVFGAGVTLFFTIYGCTPFGHADSSKSELLRKTKECAVTFPDHRAVTMQLRRVLSILLAKDAEDRPSSSMAIEVISLVSHALPSMPASSSSRAASSSHELNEPVVSLNSPGPGSPQPQKAAERPKSRLTSLPPALTPQPPAPSPGPAKRRSGVRRIFTRASEQQVAPRPVSNRDDITPFGRAVSCWGSEGDSNPAVPDGTDSTSCPGSASQSSRSGGLGSFSGGLSPLLPVKSSSKGSKGSSGIRSPSIVPSMDKLCPSFLKARRSKAIVGVMP